MKKFIMVSMIALIAAFGFVGCGSEDDGSKADLQWQNEAGSNVQDIKWISSGETNQSWDGTFANGTPTSSKGISKLSGSGDCLDNGGAPATIELRDDSTGVATAVTTGATSATIEENAAAVLVIDTVTAK